MLVEDWQQLETLCDRTNSLKERLHAASQQQTRNFDLLDRLRTELTETQAEHEVLLERIARELTEES